MITTDAARPVPSPQPVVTCPREQRVSSGIAAHKRIGACLVRDHVSLVGELIDGLGAESNSVQQPERAGARAGDLQRLPLRRIPLRQRPLRQSQLVWRSIASEAIGWYWYW